MLCDNCHNKEANVHLVQIVNGQKKESHLCEACSKEKGEELFNSVMDFGLEQFDFSNIISGLISLMGHNVDEDVALENECSNCGMKYSEFKKTALLGCDRCYENFNELLQPVIRRVQGKVEHTGKIPNGERAEYVNKRKIIKLKEELQQSIALEEFERAAKLRDEIKKIQNEV